MSPTPSAADAPARVAGSLKGPGPAGDGVREPAPHSAGARACLSGGSAPVAALLAAAVGFNLWVLAPEVTVQAPPLNDYVLHGLNLAQTVSALEGGGNPTDFWSPTIALGYPLFHYYQHFAYLAPALAALVGTRVLHAAVSIPGLLNWTGYLLLAIFPLAFYWSMRRFGFDRLAAAGGALVSSLIATNYLYGFDYGSYIWSGSGLYTQLWGMLLLPMALAQGYVALKTGRGYFLAVLFAGRAPSVAPGPRVHRPGLPRLSRAADRDRRPRRAAAGRGVGLGRRGASPHAAHAPATGRPFAQRRPP